MHVQQKHIYFPGLNTLRFYAAISVVIAHINDIGENFGELGVRHTGYPLLNALALDVQSAVTLFFVLSGFLITYLLLQEQALSDTIDVRRFYLRRLLRIWPLYYLIVLLGFVVFPLLLGPSFILSNHLPIQLVLVLVFLPNVVGGLGPLQHLWSIGLEEQFYLIWPWVLKTPARLLRISLGIILLKALLTPVVAAFQSDALNQFFQLLRFESMAIGALGAYLYFQQHRLLQRIYHPFAQALALSAMVFLALFDITPTPISHLITSLLFIILILNIATNSASRIQLEHPAFNALGQISYGIYMYHYPLLYVLVLTLNALGVERGHGYNLILYVTTISGTLFIAHLSYRYFEAPFLKLKERFAVVASKR